MESCSSDGVDGIRWIPVELRDRMYWEVEREVEREIERVKSVGDVGEEEGSRWRGGE